MQNSIGGNWQLSISNAGTGAELGNWNWGTGELGNWELEMELVELGSNRWNWGQTLNCVNYTVTL